MLFALVVFKLQIQAKWLYLTNIIELNQGNMEHWKHTKTILDVQKYEISGINIWNHRWLNTGEKIEIEDPLYHQKFVFDVYRIEVGTVHTLFAAGEFSNGVWGIYQRVSDLPKHTKFSLIRFLSKYLGF